jgi:hypothetical protein
MLVFCEESGMPGHKSGMIYGEKGAAETDVFQRMMKRWEFGEDDYGQTSKWIQSETWAPERDFAYFHNTHDQALDIVRRVAAATFNFRAQ